jgi:hypothetical protein
MRRVASLLLCLILLASGPALSVGTAVQAGGQSPWNSSEAPATPRTPLSQLGTQFAQRSCTTANRDERVCMAGTVSQCSCNLIGTTYQCSWITWGARC